MNEQVPVALCEPVSPLRQRLIDDMNMRHFSRETQRNYVRDVGRFATFLGRPPDTATAEDLRRFHVEQREAGMQVPTMNSIVAALRFFFTQTLDRPDLARRLVRMKQIRKLPVVLSIAYGDGLRVRDASAHAIAIGKRSGAHPQTRSGQHFAFRISAERQYTAPLHASWHRISSLQDQPKNGKPIAHRVRLAGSCLGDFRTPTGARSPARDENCGFCQIVQLSRLSGSGIAATVNDCQLLVGESRHCNSMKFTQSAVLSSIMKRVISTLGRVPAIPRTIIPIKAAEMEVSASGQSPDRHTVARSVHWALGYQ